MNHSTKKMNRAESDRITAIKELGCIIARLRGHGWVYPEAHHLLSGNKRIGHMATIGLNPYSHRGVPFNGWTLAQCREWFGPSLADGSKPFHAEFGSDAELLAIQNKMLEAANC